MLRVIEYGSFARVGGNEALSVDVRVIAATNVDLPALAEAGRFRSDLLDRLAFDVVTVPPLRARRRGHPAPGRAFRPRHDADAGPRLFRRVLAARRWRRCWRMPGPAMCASSRTWSSAASIAGADPARAARRVMLDPFASPWRPATQVPLAPVLSAGARAEVQETTAMRPFSRSRARLRERSCCARRSPPTTSTSAAPPHALGLSYHQLRHYLRKHAIVRAGVTPAVWWVMNLVLR